MSCVEKRVRVRDYGVLPGDSPLLAPVATCPGKQPQRMHVLAAGDFARMSEACGRDLGISLLAASGWRPHRWASRAEYERVLVEKYGSVERGRVFLAFDSPHETGLAVDLGCGGLEPRSATAVEQRETRLYRWLVEHAHEHGFHPYLAEPWHWEHPLDAAAYLSGRVGD